MRLLMLRVNATVIVAVIEIVTVAVVIDKNDVHLSDFMTKKAPVVTDGGRQWTND
jgi:hypothetical protein